MKLLILISLIFSANLTFASECTHVETGAKAMAELYIIKNESQIRDWAGDKEDIFTLASRIAETSSYSRERNSYFFEIAVLPNNGGPTSGWAWLEASCSGVEFNYQLVD